MTRYLYVGPEAERREIPGWDFGDGVLDPARLAVLIQRGHVQVLLPDVPAPLDKIGESRAQGIASEPEPPKPATRRRAKR